MLTHEASCLTRQTARTKCVRVCLMNMHAEEVIMNTDDKRKQVAEPAEEEIKKHGDQLKMPVEEAAGKKSEDAERKPDRQD